MSGRTARLNRLLFSLTQSGRQWVGVLVEIVVEYDMEQCRTDPCVFHMLVDGKVEPHVEDIVISSSKETCRYFHAALVVKFPTK